MRSSWCLAFIVSCALASCTNVQIAPEEKLVFQYSEGVQSLHQETYDDFFLACHPEWSMRDLSGRMHDYEIRRKRGEVTFSDDGIEVIKLALLGRGGFFRVGNVLRESGRLQFRTLVKPDYASINFIDRGQFPKGVIVFLLGEPLGTVLAIKPGPDLGPERRILDSLELHWIWRRNALGRSNWCLDSTLPIPQSAKFRTLRLRESTEPAETPVPDSATKTP
jgi:hypothetical protein